MFTEEELLKMTHTQLDGLLSSMGYKPSGNAKKRKANLIMKWQSEHAERGETSDATEHSDVNQVAQGELDKDVIKQIIDKRRRNTELALGQNRSYVDAIVCKRRGAKKQIALTSEEIIKARKQGVKLTR